MNSTSTPQVMLTISTQCVNKCNPAILKWRVVKFTIEQLFAHLTLKGYPVAVGVYAGNPPVRRKDRFKMSQLIGLDFDDLNPKLAGELIAHPFVKEFGTLFYSTPNHTPDNPRLRLFFVTDIPIKSIDKYESAVRRIMYLFRHYKPDKACKDASRFFYGSNNTDPSYTWLIGNVLPLKQFQVLPDPVNKLPHSRLNTNSLPIEFIEDVTRTIRFTGRKRGGGLECHCPIHPPDDSPSAIWHPDKNILYCFHDSVTYLAKDVGNAIGIRLSDYIAPKSNNKKLKHPVDYDVDIVNSSPPMLELNAQFPQLDAETVAQYVTRNEYGDAQLLIRLTGGRIVYDHSERCWYWWDGNFWKRDERHKTPELLYAPVGELYAQVAGKFTTQLAMLEAQTDNDESLLEKTRSIKRELEKRPRTLRTHTRARNVLTIATGLSGITGEEWDSKPMLLGVQNGVIDLATGQLRRGRIDDNMRKVANVEFHKNAIAPRWHQFIHEIFDNDESVVAFIQRLFGYCITGETIDHVLPVFYGRGRNGKDTLVETIGYVLGNYASAGSGDLLIEQSSFQGQAQPHVFNLMGKRLVWVTETGEGSKLNVNQVKYLTGSGRLIARPLYGNPVEFDTTHHIILFTNHKPRVPSESEDYAIWKRLLLIPLALSFVDNPIAPNERPRDPLLKDKLKAEATGILNWLIDGCLAWQEQGLNPPEAIRNATNAYARSEDIIGLFIEDRCELIPSTEISASDLLNAFNSWAMYSGYPQISPRKLSDRMTQYFEKKRTSRGIVYVGLQLQNNRM